VSDNGLVRPDAAMRRFSTNDMKRLSAAAGRPAKEVLGDEEEMFAGIIFVIRSRQDPAYTFEQACDEEWGAHLDLSAEDAAPDPQTAPGGSPGPANGISTAAGLKTRPRTSGGARSSAASSGSPAPSTTS
jgi:hypothetical protein